MTNKIGAFCTILWNDTGDISDGCIFSFEDYNPETDLTANGLVDSDIFFYANSAESLLAMLKNPNANADFSLVSIDDWITNG
jgi:hypothetical protein